MYRNVLKGIAVASTAAATGTVVGPRIKDSLRNLVQAAHCESSPAAIQTFIREHEKLCESILRGKTNVSSSGKASYTSTIPTMNMSTHTVTTPATREEHFSKLQSTEYDVLVIGGGISGVACANEAAQRGLKVALVEKDDFASGTSSKSTKLIHGGVRYLEQAFKTLDLGMLSLVHEALDERKHMLKSAEYMNEPYPILIPLSTYWEIPYMWIGIKLYELIAGSKSGVPKCSFVTAKQIQEELVPSIDAKKLNLKGGLVYWDGQMNDSRQTLALALNAERKGSTVLNYTKVTNLVHKFVEEQSEPTTSSSSSSSKGNGTNDNLDSITTVKKKVCGATVQDMETGKEYTVRAKHVINCAGPYGDVIRKMDDPNATELVVPSAGVHVVVPLERIKSNIGILVPKTADGRVLFVLPWQNGLVCGTTDSESDICDIPVPSEEEIQFIIDTLNTHVSEPITREDISSVWSGLRPLVRDPTVKDTKTLSRNHIVLESDTGLVSLMGGKLTTHRRMAQDTLDHVIGNDLMERGMSSTFNAAQSSSPTKFKPIIGQDDMPVIFGSNNWDHLHQVLTEGYSVPSKDAYMLLQNYGSRALVVAQLAAEIARTKKGARYVQKQDVGDALFDAEIKYSVDFEYARKVEDVLLRRTRKAFLDSQACEQEIDKVINTMGTLLKWGWSKKKQEKERCMFVLHHMNVKTIDTIKN